MPRYIIERTFADGLKLTADDDGARACHTVVENNAEDMVTWVHSYVSEDKSRTFCVYDAPSPGGCAPRRTPQQSSRRPDH